MNTETSGTTSASAAAVPSTAELTMDPSPESRRPTSTTPAWEMASSTGVSCSHASKSPREFPSTAFCI